MPLAGHSGAPDCHETAPAACLPRQDGTGSATGDVRGTARRAGGRTPSHGVPHRAPGGPFIRLAAVYSLDILRVCSCRATSAIDPDSDG